MGQQAKDWGIWNVRSKLARTGQKIKDGKLVIGFIGGSITDGRPRHNWPEAVTAWFVDRFKGVKIVVENAAIGATGSDLAVFRAKRDLLDRGCDLIFVDYAVNDEGVPTQRRMATREGLIRKLLASEGDEIPKSNAKTDGKAMDCSISETELCELSPDVVLVYTFSQSMSEPMLAGQVPPSIAEFEQLAQHYNLNSIWMGKYAYGEVQRGLMRWEEWLPDGLHPTSRGSYSYAQSVIAFLEQQLVDGFGGSSAIVKELPILSHNLPEPLEVSHWQSAKVMSLDSICTEGPWVMKRWLDYEWFDHVLETNSIGAKLSFHFNGRGVALAFDFGKASADFKYRINHGDWNVVRLDRPDWVGSSGWLRLSTLAETLAAGDHFVELEIVHSNDPACQGFNFRLGLVGIIK
ncbi:hypothetical protein J2Z32_003200 [Paenibacillus turicensis]|uniref:SGNH hydrolase-type esterase domain-containing protein n=1 Tax=Paenibacillus turicensis TaxID=160487 RepID=A0ABS4FW09_9BACL|nr:SGNH/GDSL hydrolase family protein [Paenibacillus turicensis]MBP1906538.1 hypothetical protein [Paenibacillus turicensis]